MPPSPRHAKRGSGLSWIWIVSIVALIGSVSVFIVIAGHVPSHSMSDATQRGASPATLMMHGWDAEIGRSAKQMQLLNISLRHAQTAAYEHERYIQRLRGHPIALGSPSSDRAAAAPVEGLLRRPQQRDASAVSCAVLQRTFKFAPQCGDDEGQSRVFPLLITGTGRAGTMYVKTALNSLGVPFAHDNEAVKDGGAASWPLAIRETREYNRTEHNTGGSVDSPTLARGLARARITALCFSPGTISRISRHAPSGACFSRRAHPRASATCSTR